MRRSPIARYPFLNYENHSCPKRQTTSWRAPVFWKASGGNWSAQAKPRRQSPAHEISKHRRKSAADLPAGSGAAGACARRRPVYARRNRAAHAGGIGRVPPLALHRSLLSRGAAVCHAGRAGRNVVADRRRGHQFSRKAGFAFARAARSGTVSRAHTGIQGFWRAVHGAADGIFCARRIADADRAGGDLRRHRKRGGARVFTRAGNSRCNSVSLEAYQRSAGEAVYYSGRKHHRTRSLRHV